MSYRGNETADRTCITWTIPKLKDELRRIGLPLGGLKAELCQRLQEYYSQQNQYFPRLENYTPDIVEPLTAPISNRGRKPSQGKVSPVSTVTLPSLPATVSPPRSPRNQGSPVRKLTPSAAGRLVPGEQARRRQNPFASIADIQGLVGDILNRRYFIDDEGVVDQLELELPEWTIDDFKNVFETLGLTRPKPATKANYIPRLLNYLGSYTSQPGTQMNFGTSSSSSSAVSAPPTPPSLPSGPVDFSKMTVVMLKDELRRLGEHTTGNKSVLIDRLEAAYARLRP